MNQTFCGKSDRNVANSFSVVFMKRWMCIFYIYEEGKILYIEICMEKEKRVLL